MKTMARLADYLLTSLTSSLKQANPLPSTQDASDFIPLDRPER